MRLLAAADLHGQRPVYDWLLAQAIAQNADAIVLAGDLLGCPDGFDTPEAAQRHEADLIMQVLEAAGTPVFYIMGNDDLVELGASNGDVQSIHACRVPYGPFAFVGYQYSLPFMGGTFEKPEDGIAADLELLGDLVGPDTVFVTHSPVFGRLDPGFAERRIGSRALRSFLDRHPCQAHIHGHSHAGFGREDRHFNVASAGRLRATIIDLPALDHQVLDHAGAPA